MEFLRWFSCGGGGFEKSQKSKSSKSRWHHFIAEQRPYSVASRRRYCEAICVQLWFTFCASSNQFIYRTCINSLFIMIMYLGTWCTNFYNADQCLLCSSALSSRCAAVRALRGRWTRNLSWTKVLTETRGAFVVKWLPSAVCWSVGNYVTAAFFYFDKAVVPRPSFTSPRGIRFVVGLRKILRCRLLRPS